MNTSGLLRVDHCNTNPLIDLCEAPEPRFEKREGSYFLTDDDHDAIRQIKGRDDALRFVRTMPENVRKIIALVVSTAPVQTSKEDEWSPVYDRREDAKTTLKAAALEIVNGG